MTAGQVLHAPLFPYSTLFRSSHDIDVTITGSNDNATISVVGSQDTAALEAGGVANATAGDPSASGQLTVQDVDSGENHIQLHSSHRGTSCTYTFNPTTGSWTYTLDQSLADPLTAGQVVHDHLVVTSSHGTTRLPYTTLFRSSNDNATISVVGSQDTAALEAGGVANATAGDPSASGQLTVQDVD